MNKVKQPLIKKLFSGSGWALFTMFVWELVEEGLENLIAFALSSALAVFITKALSTLAIITATQGIKVFLKRYLFPFIKTLTFKEGNDKMEKLKKFFSWLNANKCTLLGVGTGAVVAVSGAGVIDVASFPALVIGTLNITPIIYYVALGILTIVASFFPETIEKFRARVEQVKIERDAKAIEKEAKKEIANEQKIANQTQAQQEKAKAKEEADKVAKAEKEKADAEHKAKVQEAKAKILAETKTTK